MTLSEKWADKIAKLLRKAEDPATPEPERESLIEKAQELMTRYAIDEAMLAGKRFGEKEQIIEVKIPFHSIYSRALYYVGAAIAKHNDCKVMISKGNSLMKTDLYVIGYESDVRRVEMLNSSLQIQCIGSLAKFWSTYDSSWTRTERDRFKVRRQFIFSFADGLNDKLEAARNRGLADAGTEYGDNSVALVVRDKGDNIQLWQEQKYPRMRKSRGNFRGGGHEAASAGRKAGQRANVGTPEVAGFRKELGR
jgi:hypothetical protein